MFVSLRLIAAIYFFFTFFQRHSVVEIITNLCTYTRSYTSRRCRQTMSLHWTIIATFLYLEIGALLMFLLVPCTMARLGNRLFHSRFYAAFYAQTVWYCKLLFGILVLFLLDSIREIRKFSRPCPEYSDVHYHHHNLDQEMHTSMRLYRAQRNFFITGSALFLSFIIKRFIVLMTLQASLEAQCEASKKQAESAGNTASSLLLAQEVDKSDAMEKLLRDLDTVKADRDALKCQYESNAREYYRLEIKVIEEEKLQKAIDGKGSKKDD